MTREDFERIVRRAEGLAARSPMLYRIRTVLLGALGYGFIWFLLLGAIMVILLLAAAVYFGQLRGASLRLLELAIPAVIFIAIVLRALWIRIDPPGGARLTRESFPELYSTLERVRRTLAGPRLHQVLLDDQFNASISQVPRLGIFGWHRNYLVLGLPLMQALSAEQVTAVLAHEYGHLSGAHGKLGSWIYRVRKTWYQLMTALHERGGALAGLVSSFFDWYAPYFDAYSFAMARSNEYQADRAAADVAGAEEAAGALIRIQTTARYLDSEFWSGVYRDASESPTPTHRPFCELAGSTSLGMSAEQGAAFLEEALRTPTGLADTHPSLTDRLKSLGVPASPPGPPLESAAERFLGPKLDEILNEFDERWRQAVTPTWKERHEFVQQAKQRLQELRAADDPGVEELTEEAQLLHDVYGRDAALIAYRRVLEREPEHAVARFEVAVAALVDGNEGGTDAVEAAIAEEPGLQLPGYQLLREHYWSRGDVARANVYEDKAIEAAQTAQRIRAERAAIPFQRVYDPPDLPPDVIAALAEHLRADPFVRHAYFVRRRLQLSTEPLYVLAVEPKRRVTVKDDRRQVSQRIADGLPLRVDTHVLVLECNNRDLTPILKKVEGAKLF